MAINYETDGDDVKNAINQNPDLDDSTKQTLDGIIAPGTTVSITEIDEGTVITPEVIEQVQGSTIVTVPGSALSENPDLLFSTKDQWVQVLTSSATPINITPPPFGGKKVVTGAEGNDTVFGGGGFGGGLSDAVPTPPAKTSDSVASTNTTTTETTVGAFNIDGAGGDDVLATGSGNDTLIGGAGNDSITAGAGNDSILSGILNDTVDGGTGFDTVLLENGGGASAYTFEVVNGEVVVTQTATGETTAAANAEYIDLGDGDAIINTANTEDGTAARQSEAILGRQMTAEELEDYQQLVDEIGLDAASASLMDSSGFAEANASLTDLEYINLLYNRTFGRDVDPEGRDFYLQQLADGVIDRAKLAADLSWSDEGIASNDLVNEIDGLV